MEYSWRCVYRSFEISKAYSLSIANSWLILSKPAFALDIFWFLHLMARLHKTFILHESNIRSEWHFSACCNRHIRLISDSLYTLQKGFGIFSVSCLCVLIQLDFLCTIYRHTGLCLCLPVLFMQYLNHISVYPVTKYTSQPEARSLSIFQCLQNHWQGFLRTSAGHGYSHIADEDLNIIRNAFHAQRNNTTFCEQLLPYPPQMVVGFYIFPWSSHHADTVITDDWHSVTSCAQFCNVIWFFTVCVAVRICLILFFFLLF